MECCCNSPSNRGGATYQPRDPLQEGQRGSSGARRLTVAGTVAENRGKTKTELFISLIKDGGI